MALIQAVAVLPELGKETEQASRHTSQGARACSAIPLRQFILLRLFYNLSLDFDELFQLSDVNAVAPQGRRVRPC